MPVAGLEPARPRALDFESSTSTNSITPASAELIIHYPCANCKNIMSEFGAEIRGFGVGWGAARVGEGIGWGAARGRGNRMESCVREKGEDGGGSGSAARDCVRRLPARTAGWAGEDAKKPTAAGKSGCRLLGKFFAGMESAVFSVFAMTAKRRGRAK